MSYVVHYASAGCLPEYESEVFEEIEDAAMHVYNEWCAVAEEILREANITSVPSDREHPLYDVADLYDRGEYDHVVEAMGAVDPRENSLYSWSIEQA